MYIQNIGSLRLGCGVNVRIVNLKYFSSSSISSIIQFAKREWVVYTTTTHFHEEKYEEDHVEQIRGKHKNMDLKGRYYLGQNKLIDYTLCQAEDSHSLAHNAKVCSNVGKRVLVLLLLLPLSLPRRNFHW